MARSVLKILKIRISNRLDGTEDEELFSHVISRKTKETDSPLDEDSDDSDVDTSMDSVCISDGMFMQFR